MKTLSLFDPAFLATTTPASAQILDDFESAALGSLSGQNTGTGWNGAWVTRIGINGILAEDTFEAAALGGLNGQNTGAGWGGTWVSR